MTALASAFIEHSALAQFKVGTVDMNKVFQAHPDTAVAQAKLKEAEEGARKELSQREESFKKLLAEINKLNEEMESQALSESVKQQKAREREAKIAELKSLEREIGEFRQTRQKQLQEQMVRMRNDIVQEMSGLIQQEVKAQGYDLVLDESGMSANGVPVVLYASDQLDFSEKVIAALKQRTTPKKPSGAAATPSPAPKKP